MVYDASALLAIAFGENKGIRVRDILDRDPAPAISAINFGELLIGLERRTGSPGEDDGWPRIEPVTDSLARVAAGLYPAARAVCPKVSLADCIAVATAMKLSTRVVTTDGDYRAFDASWVEIVE